MTKFQPAEYSKSTYSFMQVFTVSHPHPPIQVAFCVFLFIYYYLIKNMVKNLGSLVTQETPSIDHKLLFFLSFVFYTNDPDCGINVCVHHAMSYYIM